MIKKVIRFELPETNSSSSHSVIISELKNGNNNLEIIDGVVYIPNPDDFEFSRTNFQAYNDTITKIVFTIAIYNSTHELGELMKFLNNLRYIICSYTGASNVVFKAIDKFNSVSKRYKNEDDDFFEDLDDMLWEICDVAFGSVDHESTDLVYEILDNKDSLKNFIFSEDSWLFLGSDGVDMEENILKTLKKHYKLVQEDDNYATLDFTRYGIGTVDIELPSLIINGNFTGDLFYKKDGFLTSIYFDNTDKIFKINNSYGHGYGHSGYPTENSLVAYSVPIGDKRKLRNVNTIVSHNGDLYLYFINECFYRNASGYFMSFGDYINYEDLGNHFLKIIKDYNLKEEQDWVRIKIEINTKEFGKL